MYFTMFFDADQVQKVIQIEDHLRKHLDVEAKMPPKPELDIPPEEAEEEKKEDVPESA